MANKPYQWYLNELHDVIGRMVATPSPQLHRLATGLLAELDDEIQHGPGGRIENLVAQTPAPIQVIYQPAATCAECGLLLRLKKVDARNYVADHTGSSDCPLANMMWKIEAQTANVVQKVEVPDFVRNAKIL